MEGENPAALMKAIETVASLSILAVFGLSAAAKGVYMYRACPPSQRPLWVGAIFLEVGRADFCDDRQLCQVGAAWLMHRR